MISSVTKTLAKQCMPVKISLAIYILFIGYRYYNATSDQKTETFKMAIGVAVLPVVVYLLCRWKYPCAAKSVAVIGTICLTSLMVVSRQTKGEVLNNIADYMY